MGLKNLLFDARDKDQSLGKKIFRNAFWLTTGDVVNRLLKLILIVLMTRVLPLSEFGAFTFSLNLISLTAVLGDLGISNLLQRRLSQGDDRPYLATSFILKLALIVLASVTTIFAALGSDPEVTRLTLILVAMMVFDALKNFFLVIHTAKNRMEKVAIANNLETAVIIVLGFFVLIRSPSAVSLAWVYAGGALLSLFFVVRSVSSFLRGILTFAQGRLMRTIVSSSWPLALGGVAWGLMNTTDSLLLGWLTNLELAAFYNAAAKIPQFLGPIGGIIIGATFPSLVVTIKNIELHKRLFQRINELLFSLTLPIAAGSFVVALPLVEKLFGGNYRPSAPILILLLANLIQTAINFFLSQLLFIHDHQMRSFVYVLWGWILMTIAGVLLIPSYGMTGAALSAVLGHGAILIAHVRFVKRHYDLNFFSSELVKSLLGTAVMLGALLPLHASRWPIFLSIPFGALVYGVALAITRPKIFTDMRNIFRPREFRPLGESQNF